MISVACFVTVDIKGKDMELYVEQSLVFRYFCNVNVLSYWCKFYSDNDCSVVVFIVYCNNFSHHLSDFKWAVHISVMKWEVLNNVYHCCDMCAVFFVYLTEAYTETFAPFMEYV